MRKPKLARGSTLTIRPVNVADEDNVVLDNACDLAKVTSLVQPLLHSTLHVPTGSYFADQEDVLSAKDLDYLADCIEGAGSLP